MSEITSSISWPLTTQLVVSTILPILVGLVTKVNTPSSVKALLLAALSVISSGLTELLASIDAGNSFDLGLWLVTAIGTFAVAAATHFGLWKPTGTSARVQAVGDSGETG